MKKTVIAFMIAFFLAMSLSYMDSIFLPLIMKLFPYSSVETRSVSTAINALFMSSVIPVLSFVVFYFSATRAKIRASKTTTLSMLLGSLTGSLLFILFDLIGLAADSTISAYSILASAVTILSLMSVSLCFIPSLTAVLYAELKEKKRLEPKL